MIIEFIEDNTISAFIILFLIFITVFFVIKYLSIRKKITLIYKDFNEKENRLKAFEKRIKEEEIQLANKKELLIKQDNERINTFEQRVTEKIEQDIEPLLCAKFSAFEYLADKVSDVLYAELIDHKKPTILDFYNFPNTKQDLNKKELLKENTLLRYELNDLLNLYPSLEEQVLVSNNETIIQEEEKDNDYLTKEEWETLSDTEKNQLILDRYIANHKKSKWEIGSSFELSCGYEFEKNGFDVEYFGIEKKLEDLGRDLIASNKEKVIIVQCKYWSKEKLIHEKHICQLYGTVIEYKLEHPNESRKIIGRFLCHNKLSEKAKLFAKYLNIEVFEELDIKEYPMIKCNVKDHIYHFPCDNNYWNMMTSKTKDKFVKVFTVEEAEKLGCRRALKWTNKSK